MDFSNCGLFHQQPQQRTRYSGLFFFSFFRYRNIASVCVSVWLSFTLSPRTSASCNVMGNENFHREFVYFLLLSSPKPANTFTWRDNKKKLHRTRFYDENTFMRLPKWQQFLRFFSPMNTLIFLYYFFFRSTLSYCNPTTTVRRPSDTSKMHFALSLLQRNREKKTLQENMISRVLSFYRTHTFDDHLFFFFWLIWWMCIGASSEWLPSVNDCAHQQIASMTPISISIIVVIYWQQQ